MMPTIESPLADSPPASSSPSMPRPSLALPLSAGLLLGLLGGLLFLVFAPEMRESTLWILPSPARKSVSIATADREALQSQTARLTKQMGAKTPRSAYLVVNTTENKFRLVNGGQTQREGLCSTGSYVHLKNSDGREWLFHTPRGLFRIQNKIKKPVWVKPDWAFIEEGQTVPPAGSAARREAGVLGDFALSLGDGYLLHGTPYQRLLGMPVSHGCVRLGDDDLADIYKTLKVGSPVFIY